MKTMYTGRIGTVAHVRTQPDIPPTSNHKVIEEKKLAIGDHVQIAGRLGTIDCFRKNGRVRIRLCEGGSLTVPPHHVKKYTP